MTIAALPWSILHRHPFERQMMEVLRNWVKRNNWWLSWAGGGALALIAVAALGLIRLDLQLTDAVPELKKALKDATIEIREDLGKLEGRQRQELAAHTSDERASRDRFRSDIAALRSHVLALKVKVDGKVNPEDIKDLVSKAQDVGASEATLLAGVTQISGVPQMQNAFAKYEAFSKPPSGFAEKVHTLKAGKLPVEQALGLMLLAKGGHWDVTGSGLTVRYEGGSATFAAKPTTSRTELLRAADVFNAISQAAETVSAEPYSRTWPPKKPEKMDAPRGTPGSSGMTPQQIAPEVPARTLDGMTGKPPPVR